MPQASPTRSIDCRPAGRARVTDGQTALAEIDYGLAGLDAPLRQSLTTLLAGFRQANGDFTD